MKQTAGQAFLNSVKNSLGENSDMPPESHILPLPLEIIDQTPTGLKRIILNNV